MKTSILLPILLVPLLAMFARAQLTIPGADGSDGVFAPTENTVVDLSLAATAAWNTPGNSNGVYDATQWAVVFKYTSVNIPAGVTVTFKGHPSGAPVVWLVSGDVVMNGFINLNAKAHNPVTPIQPPPGAYRGGFRYVGPLVPPGHGFGPGGGDSSRNVRHATPAGAVGVYGNSKLVPLIGGSGSASYGVSGAGAILIACGQEITLNGLIHARGTGYSGGSISINGAGGAIRLVAHRIMGSGNVHAISHTSNGRVRIQANQYLATLETLPPVVLETPGNPVQLWPEPAVDAFAKVVTVNGAAAPADPRAGMDLPGADLSLSSTNPVPVVIETRNLPIDSAVILRVIPRHGASFEIPASHTGGDQSLSTWTAMPLLPRGYNAMIVRATSP